MEEGTVGRSPIWKEAGPSYRLQMTAFARAVDGEPEEARTVEWSRGIVATTGVMISQMGGNVGRVV